MQHPFGLDVFKSNIFWTDWESYNIESAHKSTGLSSKFKNLVSSFKKPNMICRKKSPNNWFQSAWFDGCSNLSPRKEICKDKMLPKQRRMLTSMPTQAK